MAEIERINTILFQSTVSSGINVDARRDAFSARLIDRSRDNRASLSRSKQRIYLSAGRQSRNPKTSNLSRARVPAELITISHVCSCGYLVSPAGKHIIRGLFATDPLYRSLLILPSAERIRTRFIRRRVRRKVVTAIDARTHTA